MLTDLTIKEFLAKTAGNEPVPGGGSVSALNGALSVSLGEMVARLTIGKKKYAEYEEEMKELADRFEQVRYKLLEDVDRDSDAYNQVFAAFKLPKESCEEKNARHEAIQKATLYAARVPLDVARKLCDILPLLEQIINKGNRNAITDAYVATICACNGILGALMNTRINLTTLDNCEIVNRIEAEAKRIEREAIEMAIKVMKHVKKTLDI